MGRGRRQSEAVHTVVAVGLTGSIGAGKSTALTLFGDCGAVVISADRLVHELYQRPAVAAMVAAHFGPRVLAADDTVDRSALAQAVLGRPEELRWLEELTHPLVAEEIRRRLDTAPRGSVVVCEVPLLFESGFEDLFDLVITVEAGSEVRRLRSTHQFGLEQFTELEALQASHELRVRESDLVVSNDGSLAQLREAVQRAYEAARERLRTVSEEERG